MFAFKNSSAPFTLALLSSSNRTSNCIRFVTTSNEWFRYLEQLRLVGVVGQVILAVAHLMMDHI